MIIVKANLNQPDNDFLSSLGDAVKYIFDKADALGQPAVINISLGTSISVLMMEKIFRRSTSTIL